jgi:glyoxylase-like metal-dependent hydrolase (beta-lactamase superfamily II)/rhodanese-related sulfurtransferase
MIFHQLFDPESSTYTYVVGDEDTRDAVIIDPVLGQETRDLALVRSEHLRLVWILDTHVHADHVTGANALKAKTGAMTGVGEACGTVGYDHPINDGEVVAFGNETLKAISTPGHTPGSTSFAWRDRVFTGDTLLIGGCGRADFQNGDARELYRSITRRLFTLPEATLVFPAHDYKGCTQSSIGAEKATNPRLAGHNEDEFVALMASLGLARPKKIDEAVPLNKTGGPVAEGDAPWISIPAAQAAEAMAQPGVLVADLRDPNMAGADPLPNATLVPHQDFDAMAQMAARCDSLILVCGIGQRSMIAARELAARGATNVANVVGGVRSMRMEQQP